MSDITIKVITELEELEALSGVWDYLVQSCDDSSIFITHEWASTWWLHFGSGKRMNILVFERAGEPLGIIPLMITRYSIGPFAITALETIGAVNDNRVGIISPGYREDVMEAFLSYLQNELARLPLIARLELVPDDGQFIRLLREKKLLYGGLLIQEKIVSLAPYISLYKYKSWDDYFASLSMKRRKILRRITRQLEKTHTVEYKQFSSDSIESGLDALFELHKKRWQTVNIKSPFSDPRMRKFYSELSSRLLAKDWLHFSHVSIDGKFASLIYAFVFNQKFLSATYARDLRYSEYSVGHVHLMYAIREAIAKQLREFDFLRGDEPHKFHWTDKFRRYLRVTIISNKPCALLRLKFLLAFLRLSEIIQHKHSLRELYSIYKLERAERREKKRMGLLHNLK